MNRRKLLQGTIACAAIFAAVSGLPLLAAATPAEPFMVTDNWFSFMLEQPGGREALGRRLFGKRIKFYGGSSPGVYEYEDHGPEQIVWRRAADQTRLDYNYIYAFDKEEGPWTPNS